MSFGISNVGTAYKRAMDFAFKNIMFKFIIIYLDDFIVFSENPKDHLKHLDIVFKKCREYGISLNPKNYLFGTSACKFLGHIL